MRGKEKTRALRFAVGWPSPCQVNQSHQDHKCLSLPAVECAAVPLNAAGNCPGEVWMRGRSRALENSLTTLSWPNPSMGPRSQGK